MKSVTTWTALLASVLCATSASAQWHFNYGTDKVRGVNLGGWLVLEPWITPSLFEKTGDDRIVDEYTFGERQDRGTARAALKEHWDTFITEEDFEQIAAANLNHVRIPIGYWAFETSGGEPYIDGQLEYLQKAVGWGAKHNVKVIVDLHGAPGSQNGFDNSGQRIDFPLWQTSDENVRRTNNVLKSIADMFGDDAENVPIIAPLNEPAGYRDQQVLDVTRQYWLDSYGNIRERAPETVELIHDAFQDLSYWDGFLSNGQGVAIDTHIYQMFSPEGNAMSDQERYDDFCGRAGKLSSFHLWTIVGEWTATGNDCAKYLNGRGIGSRYDGTHPDSQNGGVGSCKGLTGHASDFSQDYKDSLRRLWEAQVVTYEKAAGWIQWTWKAEEADEWTYKAGLENGWIPWDPTDLIYNMCN